MKAFFFGFFGIVFGIFVILFFIYVWFRSMLNRYGWKGKSLLNIYQEAKRTNDQNKIKHKQVSGMTHVLLPRILRDFPDFQETEFYVQTEKCIRVILKSIEEKKTDCLQEEMFFLLREKMALQISDLCDAGIERFYDDIIFHKHAIKSYKNVKGVIELKVSSSLEYYYIEKKDGKVLISDQYKKQTRFTTTYVYVYDVQKAGFDARVLGITCPSCGGPLSNLKEKACPYCQSGIHIQVANLTKCWKVIDLKEDY